MLHDADHGVIVSIGMLEVNKVAGDERVLVDIFAAYHSLHMHNLVVVYNILEVIPTEFHSPALAVFHNEAHVENILRNC